MAVRVLSWVPGERVSMMGDHQNGAKHDVTPSGHRDCYFSEESGAVKTGIYRWLDLPVGARIDGPAVVEAPHTTFVVAPGWEFELGGAGLVWLQDGGGAKVIEGKSKRWQLQPKSSSSFSMKPWSSTAPIARFARITGSRRARPIEERAMAQIPRSS